MTTMLYSALRNFVLALLLTVAFALVPAGLRAQEAGEAVAVPSSRVSLIPPAEFYLSDLFSGFFHDASTASIVVTELPVEAYAQLNRAFKPGVKASGMTLGAKTPMAVDGRPGFLMRATQEVQGATWDKWLLIFWAQDFTGMVVISAAQVVEMPEDVALAALSSTKILSSEGYDPRSNLSYIFQETDEFELLSVLQGNTASLKSKEDDRILYVITASTQIACGSLEGKAAEFSEQAIRSLDAVKVTSVSDPQEIVIDSLSGLEQLADGVDTQSDEDLVVYHATLFEDCRYYRFFGITPRNKAESYRADFRRMTESFARK